MIKKRVLAIILSLALIFNGSFGLDFSVQGNDELTGFGIAGTMWEDDEFVCSNDVYWYESEWYTDLGSDNWISLAMITGTTGDDRVISPVTGLDNLTIKDGEGNEVTDERVVLTNKDEIWNDETEEFEEVPLSNGVYLLKIYDVGDFTLCYDYGDEHFSVTIHVTLPLIALYSDNEASLENLVAIAHQEFEYTPGATYYLMARDDCKDDEQITGVNIHFIDELQMDENDIDWKNSDYAPISIEIPEALVGDLWDAVSVEVTRGEYHHNEETEEDEWEEWKDEYLFHFMCNQEGLVITGTDWDNIELNGSYFGIPVAMDPDDHFDEYSKDFGCEIRNTSYVTLGIKKKITDDETGEVTENEEINVLTYDNFDKLSIIDEFGNKLSSDEYSITKTSIDYSYWDDESQTNVNKKFDIGDVCSIRIDKIGNFRIVYTNGEDVSMVAVSTELPAVAAYGKPVVCEDYCLGSENVLYSANRNTFYICLHDKVYDWDEFLYTIRKGCKVYTEGDYDNVKVSTDKSAGIVKVSIDPAETEDIEICVYAREEHKWYRNEDGEKILDSTEVHDDWENGVWFRHTDDALSYSDEVEENISKADAVIDLIDALPESSGVTYEDKDDIESAREAYDNLTDEQKLLVDDSYQDKLTNCEGALSAAISAKEEYDSNKAAADVVIDLIDALPELADIDTSDLESINTAIEKTESAREAYDNLTDEQKNFVSKDSYSKLYALEKVLTYATEINTLSDTIKTLQGDVASLTSELTDANKEIKKLEEDVESLQNDKEELNSKLNKANADIEELKTQKSTLESAKEELQGQVDALTESLSAAGSTIDYLNNQISNIESLIAEKNAALENANNEISGLEAEKASLESEKATLEALKDELEESNENLEKEKKDLETLNATLAKTNEALDEAILALEEQKAALEAENTSLENDKAALEAEKASLNDEAVAISKELEDAKTENQSLKTENTKLETEKAALEAEKANAESKKLKVGDSVSDSTSNASYTILTLGTDEVMGTVVYEKALKSKAKVTIPSTITVNGTTFQVTKIAAGAFKNDKKLKKLVISEGIKEIGANAFFGCKKLKKITVRSSVLKKIGKKAFKKVNKKAKVTVPSDKKKKYKKLFKKAGIKAKNVK